MRGTYFQKLAPGEGKRMGSIGTPEMIVVAVLALLVFGPKKLPEIGKNVGAAIREFRRASRDLMSHFEDDDPPRVRSFGRHSSEAENYSPPATVPAYEHEGHYAAGPAPGDMTESAHPAGAVHTAEPAHAADAAYEVDAHPAPPAVSGTNGDHSSIATSAPAHNGEAVAATTSTAAHHAAPAESERNA
jgi:sec-independent protein translocase protein TatA